jgi:hypothetical protein
MDLWIYELSGGDKRIGLAANRERAAVVLRATDPSNRRLTRWPANVPFVIEFEANCSTEEGQVIYAWSGEFQRTQLKRALGDPKLTVTVQRRQAGRRKKNAGVRTSERQCSLCGGTGHNRRTCTATERRKVIAIDGSSA